MPHKSTFRVIHVSGQDDGYKASELNHHSPLTKGWQSSRFCLYPQDIVLQLDRRTRLRKIQLLSHQYLIATKIEFYVGDVPEGTTVSLQNARYTRLGYVSLSENMKTGYKARELKSVHVDAVGVFLKLVIHKNHINKFNLFNQVGVIAINVIGDPFVRSIDPTDPEFYQRIKTDPMFDPAIAGLYNRPEYISPLDDLAFDMYQDPEVAHIIRQLESKKQEAVLQERFDYAKRLKETIADLQKVGEKLGKMEVEKRQAVESEDYDRAKLKKVQMDEYRLQVYTELQVNDLLEIEGSRYPQPAAIEPSLIQMTPRISDFPPSPTPQESPMPVYEDRPLPIAHVEPAVISPAPPFTPYDERVIPAYKPAEPDASGDEDLAEHSPTEHPGSMSERDLREASSAIEIFGQAIVSKAYSKTWSHRENALFVVHKELQELEPGTSKDEARSAMRAAIFLIRRGIDDKVYAVYISSLNLLKYILTDFVAQYKISRQDVLHSVEKLLPHLLHKSADTALRNRDAAKECIMDMAKFPEVKPTMVIPHECVKPFKLSIPPRQALSRTGLVEQMYKDLGMQDSGLTVDNVMQFCLQALQHHAGEVREAAERIIKALYRDGSSIKDYLPPDTEKTRKNTLYRQLFEDFDKADGKPTKSDLRKRRMDEESKKQAEVEALQAQLQQLRSMAAGKAPVDESLLKEDAKTKAAKGLNKKKARAKSTLPIPTDGAEDDTATLYNIDTTCIFCSEKNENFTEEGLDLHYWKNCPMLKRCGNCKQVVEISGYTEHLLSECDAHENFSKCPRCTEAILKPEFDQHISDKACTPAQSGLSHCPLCHTNVGQGEEEWKAHLMSKDGCKQNPRRLLALNKQPQGGKAAGAGGNKAKAAKNSIPRPGPARSKPAGRT